MIQPYVSSIDDDGERALVFIDGSVLARHDERRDAQYAPPTTRDAVFRREQMSMAEAEPDAVGLRRGRA